MSAKTRSIDQLLSLYKSRSLSGSRQAERLAIVADLCRKSEILARTAPGVANNHEKTKWKCSERWSPGPGLSEC